MERKIMISESQADDFAERMAREAAKVCDSSGPPTKEKIKHCFQIVIQEIKEMRTRKRIVPPEGGITLREASRQYHIPNSTISGWVKLGYLDFIEETTKQKFLLEEEIAHLATIYHTAKGKGKRTIEKYLRDLVVSYD